jgi:uncharacterized protein (DUF362 family)
MSAAAKVSLVKTADRESGVPQAIDLLGINPVEGKDVLLKPNFNTADPFPGSTHNDTLRAIIGHLRRMGSSGITVADRSGPADTGEVMRELGVDRLCAELDVPLLNFEALGHHDWKRLQPEGSHWRKGFDVARPVLEAESVVTTGCLKTHRFGAIFTMSLKLSIGMTHKRNMKELHTSLFSMRKMIAEVNIAYCPDLVVLDGIEAFTDGGPMQGTRKKADVILAGTDRVAVDAVGVALLKRLGSNSKIMGSKIFEQGQIARAVELGLGVSGPEEIEIVTGDEAGDAEAERLRSILARG